jgi:hypothetical protein
MPRSFDEREGLAKAARGYYLFCERATVDLAIRLIGTVSSVRRFRIHTGLHAQSYWVHRYESNSLSIIVYQFQTNR